MSTNHITQSRDIIEEQKQDFLDAFPQWSLQNEMQDDGWLVMEFKRS